MSAGSGARGPRGAGASTRRPRSRAAAAVAASVARVSCARRPAELLARPRGVHHHGDPHRVDPRGLRRHQRQPVDRLGGRAHADARHRERQPAQRAGEVAHGDRPVAGEVVDAGLALAAHGGGDGARDVVGVHELERRPRVGQHGPDRQLAHDRREALDQRQRVGPRDDARAEQVRLDRRALQRVAQRLLQLGLLRRVVVRVGPARGDVLGQRLRVVGVEAVGGDRRGVDEPRARRAPPRTRCASPRG